MTALGATPPPKQAGRFRRDGLCTGLGGNEPFDSIVEAVSTKDGSESFVRGLEVYEAILPDRGRPAGSYSAKDAAGARLVRSRVEYSSIAESGEAPPAAACDGRRDMPGAVRIVCMPSTMAAIDAVASACTEDDERECLRACELVCMYSRAA